MDVGEGPRNVVHTRSRVVKQQTNRSKFRLKMSKYGLFRPLQNTSTLVPNNHARNEELTQCWCEYHFISPPLLVHWRKKYIFQFKLPPDYTFSPSGQLMHKEAFKRLHKLIKESEKRDPDRFNMHISNGKFSLRPNYETDLLVTDITILYIFGNLQISLVTEFLS